MAMYKRVIVETKVEEYTEKGQKIYNEIREQLRTSRAKDMNGQTKTTTEERGTERPEILRRDHL
jgi:L-rhamnose mutarotase